MSLQAVIADLQRRISRLEAQAGGGEQLSPNSLQITPGGVVTATGLIIPAGGTPSPGPANEIQWQRTSDGALIADLGAFSSGATEVLFINAQAAAAADISEMSLSASDDLGVLQSSLEVIQQARGTTSSVTAVAGGIAGHRVTIIDQGDNSSFLQLLNAQKLYAQVGGVAVTWPGGSKNSNATPVVFGSAFPTALIGLLLTSSATSTGGVCFAYNTATSAAGFSVVGSSDTAWAPGTTASISWLALGN